MPHRASDCRATSAAVLMTVLCTVPSAEEGAPARQPVSIRSGPRRARAPRRHRPGAVPAPRRWPATCARCCARSRSATLTASSTATSSRVRLPVAASRALGCLLQNTAQYSTLPYPTLAFGAGCRREADAAARGRAENFLLLDEADSSTVKAIGAPRRSWVHFRACTVHVTRLMGNTLLTCAGTLRWY